MTFIKLHIVRAYFYIKIKNKKLIFYIKNCVRKEFNTFFTRY